LSGVALISLVISGAMSPFWANELGRQTGQKFDVELLFVCAAFHDLGLLEKFSSADDRFEVDSTNAVRCNLARACTDLCPLCADHVRSSAPQRDAATCQLRLATKSAFAVVSVGAALQRPI
jgi:hypothetical protein